MVWRLLRIIAFLAAAFGLLYNAWLETKKEKEVPQPRQASAEFSSRSTTQLSGKR